MPTFRDGQRLLEASPNSGRRAGKRCSILDLPKRVAEPCELPPSGLPDIRRVRSHCGQVDFRQHGLRHLGSDVLGKTVDERAIATSATIAATITRIAVASSSSAQQQLARGSLHSRRGNPIAIGLWPWSPPDVCRCRARPSCGGRCRKTNRRAACARLALIEINTGTLELHPHGRSPQWSIGHE